MCISVPLFAKNWKAWPKILRSAKHTYSEPDGYEMGRTIDSRSCLQDATEPKPPAKLEAWVGPIRACYRQASQDAPKLFSSASLAPLLLKLHAWFYQEITQISKLLFVNSLRSILAAKAFYPHQQSWWFCSLKLYQMKACHPSGWHAFSILHSISFGGYMLHSLLLEIDQFDKHAICHEEK